MEEAGPQSRLTSAELSPTFVHYFLAAWMWQEISLSSSQLHFRGEDK